MIGRSLLLIAGAVLVVACSSTDDQTAVPEAPAEPVAEAGPGRVGDADAALAAGLMPDVVGRTLTELGDHTSILDDLHGLIGEQVTRWVASDAAPPGTIAAQRPDPGTPLAQVGRWVLDISDGGPVVAFDDLPRDVADFAAGLAGFDEEELIIERTTGQGTAYKTDRWLFGIDCAAVDAAYRTFSDPRYNTACPGAIETSPLD